MTLHVLINKFYAQIFKIWRRKRFDLFIHVIKPQPGQRLIDVGGDPDFWSRQPPMLRSIDTLNIHPYVWNEQNFPEHHIRALMGDGCEIQFPDRSYDIAYSNSVIEHVGDWPRQQAFAREIRRVGKSVWVQTPAFGCPVEPHYLAPFVHWLPKNVQRKIVRRLTPWGLLQKPSKSEIEVMVETTRLLKKHEMQQLFPDCEIRVEHLLGIFPKSYIAIRKSR